MSGVSLDVTQSKQAEEELSRAKEAAEAANQAKDEFLAILSHELRTPLTPVLAAVAALREDETVPEHITREVDMIRRNIEVEARLIDDLLDVTGIARGKIELNRQVVDVRLLVEHALHNYCAGVARKKDLRVTTEVTATETHVLADSSRMTQVFWNLLQNACKFTPTGGAIHIRVSNESPNESSSAAVDGSAQAARPDLIVEISDTGIGISPENMSRIFNAFEQGERSRTRRFGGLGLGLAITRTIVELHGGTVSAASEGDGRGARITIRLHTVPAPPADAARRPRNVSPASRSGGGRSLRVLLVEDHPDTAEQLSRLLKRAGHHVITANSLREARAVATVPTEENEKWPFDLLISDLGLPDGRGVELMRELGRHHSVPGIALSGFGMREDVEASLAAGFLRHMTKPVDWSELKNAIEKVAEQIPA